MILNSIIAADLWFENLLLGIRTPFFVHLASGVTFFGSVTTVIGIAGIIGLYLWSRPHLRPFLAGLMLTLAGAAASGYALKEIVGRARPSGLIPAIAETGFSFPSGHATASMALYGFIAFLLYMLYPRYKRIVMVVAILVILSIGFSRLYLGVHFPSDVIAGFALGGLWLLAGMKLTNRLQTPR